MNTKGAALVVGLLLLLAVTLLAISGLTGAALELQMSGNEQYQERAFQAAEAGIAQALTAPTFDTAVVVGSYDDLTGPDPTPIRGTGAQIAHCPEVPDATAVQQCEYFLRYDTATGPAAVAPSRDGTFHGSAPGVLAHHFTIDSYGVASRGAVAGHSQGFFVLGPEDGGAALAGPAQRTYWRQRGAD